MGRDNWTGLDERTYGLVRDVTRLASAWEMMRDGQRGGRPVERELDELRALLERIDAARSELQRELNGPVLSPGYTMSDLEGSK